MSESSGQSEFGLSDKDLKLFSVFHPVALKEMRDLRDRRIGLVHYTSADVAINIINEGKLWLRNTSLMNDASEVEFGLSVLKSAIDENWAELSELLNSWMTNGANRFRQHFEQLASWLPSHSYVACLSKFSPNTISEGRFHHGKGKLSMWRSYAGQAPVAFVFKNDQFINSNASIPLVSSPVHYAVGKNDRIIESVLKGILRQANDLTEFVGDQRWDAFANAVAIGALCIKHHSFYEEQEWRLVKILENEFSVELPLRLNQKVIGGQLQDILELDLGFGEDSQTSLLANIDRILIGPTPNPKIAVRAMKNLLNSKGLGVIANRVFDTEIPYRMK